VSDPGDDHSGGSSGLRRFCASCHSGFVIDSSFVIGHSSFREWRAHIWHLAFGIWDGREAA